MVEAALAARSLSKRFGSLLVTDDVSIELRAGEALGLIGPNGAGKSTLIAQLAGRLPPDSGQVLLEGRDVSALPAHARARAGLVQSFQVPSLFASFSTLANVAIAAQAAQGHSYSFLRRADRTREYIDPARALIDEVGLSHCADRNVGALSHGERRYVELAVALAARPKALLLDEPLAGLSRADSERMIAFIGKLKSRYAILLVEHDMEAVFSLADSLCVLVQGRIIARGAPADVRADPAVIEAYLGDDASTGGAHA